MEFKVKNSRLFLKLISTTGPVVPDIDQSLALYKDQIKMIFSQKWSSHKCSKPGYILAYIPEKLLI